MKLRAIRHKTCIVTGVIILAGSLSLAQSGFDFSLVVPQSELTFSHEFHVMEQEIECIDCHTEVEASTRAADQNLPSMEECGACHDIEDDDECGTCHKNPEEPLELVNPIRSIDFNHEKHISGGIDCVHCHGSIASDERSSEAHMPKMGLCMKCHDGAKADKACRLCHGQQVTLADIHPADWRHQHGDRATFDDQWCLVCHLRESDCLQCHRGDNLTGNIHDLNFRFTHGLEAASKKADCSRCHETGRFCVECHEANDRMPLRHSSNSWASDHGRFARNDIENCASCHDSGDPTCARGGCHNDLDGARGTNPRIHAISPGQFDDHGPWHDDEGYYCYQCHRSTAAAGVGFCGYCHR